MLGPDGQPGRGIAVWLWGESTDGYNFLKFAPVTADGTFGIIHHQNGTFTIEVWIWQEEREAADQSAGTAARAASLPTASRRP